MTAGPAGLTLPPLDPLPEEGSVPALPAVVLGQGNPILLLHGYAMSPRTYLATARLLAEEALVVIPDLFALQGRWTYHRVLAALLATLDALCLDQVTVIGHSFGGGFELGLAARHPGRVVDLVFADTLGLSREWVLAEEAVHPLNLVRLAWPPAVADFARSWLTRPTSLARAAWWGFTSDRRTEVAAIAGAGLACHVLWASRDTLLSRADGEEFARDLGASFTVVDHPGGPVDHDWMYRHPHLFLAQVSALGLTALSRTRQG